MKEPYSGPERRQEISLFHRFMNAGIIALLFGVIPLVVSDFYYEFLDKTQYYQITNAEVVNTNVKACQDSEVLLTRNALIDLQAKAISELILYRINAPDTEIAIYTQELSVNKGAATMKILLPIPCKASAGDYFWRGTVTYDIKGDSRITFWESTKFHVIQ